MSFDQVSIYWEDASRNVEMSAQRRYSDMIRGYHTLHEVSGLHH